MILPSINFKEHLEKKYKQDFDLIPIDSDLQLLFDNIKNYVNIDIYVKLLSFIDMWDYDNFQRFFSIALRKFYDEEIECNDIEKITDNTLLQILCIICLQYYFS
jgi:hypothetical protein